MSPVIRMGLPITVVALAFVPVAAGAMPSDTLTLPSVPSVTATGHAPPDPVSPADASMGTITPDWIFDTEAPMLSSPKAADLDGDDVMEIILTTYAPGPNPVAYGLVFVLDMQGNVLPGWPVQTPGPIPATPAVGDLDGNGVSEIVVGEWQQMHVFEPDGTELAGWPKPLPATQAAALEDLDGDDDLEILYPSNQALYIFHHDGTFFSGWPKFAPDLVGSPALGNLDGDPEPEIVAGTFRGPVGPDPFEVYAWDLDGTVLTGFPFATSGVNKVPPALGDIDGDDMVEIVIPSYDTSNNDYLYAIDGTGALEPGWPVRGERIRLSAPSLSDVDGDGDLEIFIGGGGISPIEGRLYGLEHDGAALSGFPITLNIGQVNSTPVVQDTDGDSQHLEIFVKNTDNFFGYHTNGDSVTGFPYFLSDASHTGTTSPTPCVTDLDGDGDLEAIFAATFSQVALVDFTEAVDPARLHWACYKQDAYNRSFFDAGASASVLDMSVSDRHGLIAAWPNPGSSRIRLALHHDETSPWTLFVCDASGRRVRTIEPVDGNGDEAALHWDGRDGRGRRVASGVYTIVFRGVLDGRDVLQNRRVVWLR